MLTLRTKLALAVLHDIQYKDYQLSTSLNPSPSEIAYLLQKLSKGLTHSFPTRRSSDLSV